MKNRDRKYWIAAVLLLLWAAVDLYRYLVTGREIAVHYAGQTAVLRLVQNQFIWGAVKGLAGGILLAVWLRRGRRMSAQRAIPLLLSALLLVLWAASMFCLTAVDAEFAADREVREHAHRATWIAEHVYADDTGHLDEGWIGGGANGLRYRLWQAADTASAYQGNTSLSNVAGESSFVSRESADHTAAATAVFTGEGELIAASWQDYFYFEYMTEEEWAAGQERSANKARALFDREKLTEAGQEMVDHGRLFYPAWYDIAGLRLTGVFDGTELKPVRIEGIRDADLREALDEHEVHSYTLSWAAETFDLPWTTLYEDMEAAAPGEELVTLYSDYADLCLSPVSPSFTYDGTTYADLSELLRSIGPELREGWREDLARFEGMDMLLLSVNYCCDTAGNVSCTPYYYGEEAYQEEAPEVLFYTVSAVYTSPWRTAMDELREVYILTLLLSACLGGLFLFWLRFKLLRPVEMVGQEMAAGYWERRGAVSRRPWREAEELEQNWRQLRDERQANRNQIKRLQTALDYAENAEKNRRQMVSNIAHELKTPLAVVHSYAEGLKEHIAEEKREKYLDVILSESERMDAMVLEMLDLSRLEAGKVKLSRDTFSLSELVREVFDRLSMAAEAKGLTVDLQLKGDLPVTADRSRIEQVVENFATNAIKYTPPGAAIHVRADRRGRWVECSVENEGAQLPPAALDKVWETFYRADESRSGNGTGLGLTIAKSIVELHGGSCSVFNTRRGVEFGFRLGD